MIETPVFKLWFRRQLGQVMAWEADLQIPDTDLKIEIRRGGCWTTVDPQSLT